MIKTISRFLFVGLLTGALPAVVPAQLGGPGKEAVDPPAKKERKKEEVLRIKGELTAADAKEPPTEHIKGQKRAGSYRKVHDYKMTPGKTYVIEMTDPESKGPNNKLNLDPYLRLEDSTGKERAFNDDIIQGIDQNARIIFTPPKEDNYRIIATTCLAGMTGPYELTARPVDFGAIPGMAAGVSMFLVPTEIGDLTIYAVPPWGLNSSNSGSNEADTHGYIEYRFIIENNSETDSHTVKLTLPRDKDNYRNGHLLQSLRHTVEVKPGATRNVSIFQPDLPLSGSNAQVEIDGRPQHQSVPMRLFTSRGNRTNPSGGSPRSDSRPVILVPSDALLGELKGNAHKSAVAVKTNPPTDGASYGSQNLIYSEPGPYFNKHYIYYETIRFQTASLLPEGWSKHWLGYGSWDGVVLTAEVWLSAPATVQAALTQYVECGGTLLMIGAVKLPESWERCRKEEPGFVRYYPGFGQCLVANKVNPKTKKIDVAAWDPDDWRLIFSMWERAPLAWQQVRSPTDANKEFEIVSGLAIPVRGLLIAMFLFVVLIGPVNVYWLARSKRRIWLLWTVPLFSLVTCILLVGYMLATEGWHGHVHGYGITVLDETAQRATTIGWQGYYCPTTPAGGLRFSLDTELTPHLNYGRGSMSSTRHPYGIEWADEQLLSEGWVVAKIPIHFMVRRSETRRERVTLHKNNDGSLAIVNSLGADIRRIHLAGPDGKIHAASDIRAGAEAKLEPTDQRAANQLEMLNRVFAGTWIHWADEMAKNPEEYLRPGCYVAELDESPFLEQGLRHTQTRTLRSVVFGILKTGE